MVEKDKKYYEKQETPVLFVNKGTGVTVAPSFTWVIESYRQNPGWEEVIAEEKVSGETAGKPSSKKGSGKTAGDTADVDAAVADVAGV